MRCESGDYSVVSRWFALRAALTARLWPALCLPVHAGLNLLTNEFTATREGLQAELSRRFPITRRAGELASVSLHDPQLVLDGNAKQATRAPRLMIVGPLLRPSSGNGKAAVSSGPL